MTKSLFCYSISTNAVKAVLLSVSTMSTVWAQDHIVPPMVNIPAGEFMMGANSGDVSARPMHQVSIQAFQMAKYPVTVAEFRLFVRDSGYKPSSTCNDYMDEEWFSRPEGIKHSASWDKHRFQNNEYQPVTCVNWQDAHAYVDWLSEKTGVEYRLPTEQEWEYAERAGTTSRYFWGDDPNWTQACLYGNFADQMGEYIANIEYGASNIGFTKHVNCDDGEPYNSIVGLYRPNPFGLYDMVGNISQYLDSCYYPGYQARSSEEMDLDKCEKIAHRTETWHFPPDSHADRGRTDRIDSEPWALMGFRLAADGHAQKLDQSTVQFESDLQQAITKRLATRPQLPKAPENVHLVKLKRGGNSNSYRLNWQPSSDQRVIGYDIYRTNSPYVHMYGGFYQRYYDKVETVNANVNTLEVKLPEGQGSFRVVSKTEKMDSLASKAAAITEHKRVEIPGRINMNDTIALENITLWHSRVKDNPEPFFLSKLNHGFEQPLVTASFNVDVKKSAWYTLNYRGGPEQNGQFFKLWQGNKLVGEINYDEGINDKTSNRHKVFLEQGRHTLQLSVKREGWERWSMTWLEFAELEG